MEILKHQDILTSFVLQKHRQIPLVPTSIFCLDGTEHRTPKTKLLVIL